MRYFEFTFRMKKEDIKSEKVRLKEYSYDNPVEALNNYMFKNLSNGVSFLIYRVDEKGLRTVYAIDDRTRGAKEAFDEILMITGDILDVKVKTDSPFEITMLDFDTRMIEVRRRGYSQYWSKIVDQAGVLIYDDRDAIVSGRCGFLLNEAVARKDDADDPEDHLFDASLIEELGRIKADSKKRGKGELKAVPAHYVIAARSKEAGSDITLKLMTALAEAGRLPSGRMEFITEIDAELYKHPGLFEKVIENSCGGTIVIDMTGRFAAAASSYQLTCKYLCNVIREHRNDNLFVFLYDINNKGFAYFLMPLIEKFIYLVKIREGSGDGKAAEGYLKHLIAGSEFAGYSSQAGEFLETMNQDVYTQTEILRAYESFESWCMRKNLLKSYDTVADGAFFIERDTDDLSGYEKLNSLIGLKSVKEQIDKVILANKAEKQREKHGGKGRSMHMIFEGNPGTAKTTVAEIFAQIAKECGILASGTIVEKAGMDLSGFLCGIRIEQAFEEAKGGVLFIDEAYSLSGDAAVTALIRGMEMYRKDVIVILAGYKESMDKFLELNDGLKSRIPYTVVFPDYKPGELLQIYDHILKQDGYTATAGAREAAHEIFVKACRIRNFGNGRYARTLAEKSTLNMSVRLARKYGEKDIPVEKLYKVLKDDVFDPDDPYVNTKNGEKRRGRKEPVKSAGEQLESMIGLESAKQIIKGAVATFKMQKRLRKKGVDLGNNTMHMVFTGNPGTAKTTTARLVAQILKNEGILSSGVFVEAGRADLIGEYAGQTAPKVKSKFDEANGGVLFIDEAYSLIDDKKGSYGDEAINTIVQEMDNRKDDIIVIFAGYPDEMRSFIDRNPGMSSRIAFRVNFADYSTEELIEITKLQVSDRHLRITDEALEKLVPVYDAARLNRNFGNGRYVRRAVELAISNLAVRLDNVRDSDLTEQILTTIEAVDIAAPELDEAEKPKRRMGFAA